MLAIGRDNLGAKAETVAMNANARAMTRADILIIVLSNLNSKCTKL